MSLCDETKFMSIRKKQCRAFIDLLINIGGWYCQCCNLQLYSKKHYISHIGSATHKAKGLGTPLIECSNKICRKKFATQNEFEEHLQYSHRCFKSPKNSDKVLLLEGKEIGRLLRKGVGGENWNATEISFYNNYMKKTRVGDDVKDYVLKPNEYGVLESVPTFVSLEEEEPIQLKTANDYLKKWDSEDKQVEAYENELEEAGRIWSNMTPCEPLEDVEYKLKKNNKI